MKIRNVIFSLIVMLVFGAARASACSCAFGGDAVCQDYWEVSAVFLGTVIDSRSITVKAETYEHRMRVVRLSLDSTFRGVEGGEVEVITGFGGGDCGFGFRQAQQYLVFANRNDKDGKLYTSICSRTKAISEADNDLAYIRGLVKAKPGATIRGEIMKYQRDKEGTLANQPLTGITVRIQGNKTIEVASDEKGHYSAENLEAGDYTVTVSPPDRLTAHELEKKIKAYDRGCTVVSFWLESNAQIAGKVVNPQGLPVPRAEIFLIDADKPKYQGYFNAAYADEEGRYAFKRIPPGRYVLTIRFDGMTGQNRPFPLFYYPGVSDKSQAKVFTIEEGQQAENHDLVMLPMPREYDVQGTVTWSDGTPATTARVEYMEANVPVIYGAKVDEQGRFSFKAYEGLRIGVRATIERQGKHLYSNNVEVSVGSSVKPVKIVFTNQ